MNSEFRFILEKGDYSPEAPFKWKSVQQVIIPDLNLPFCPICLDSPIAPKVTKCGHVFCFVCILEYMVYPGRGSWRFCPVCGDIVFPKQLKSARLWTMLPETDLMEFQKIYLRDSLDKCTIRALTFDRLMVSTPSYLKLEVYLPEIEALLIFADLKQYSVPKIDSMHEFFNLICRSRCGNHRMECFLKKHVVDSNIQELLFASVNYNLFDLMCKYKNSEEDTTYSLEKEEYFYQSSDGRRCFLYPIPQDGDVIIGKIKSKQEIMVTNESKNKYLFLKNLPNGTKTTICQINHG